MSKTTKAAAQKRDRAADLRDLSREEFAGRIAHNYVPAGYAIYQPRAGVMTSGLHV